MSAVPVLIPAYQPGPELMEVVSGLVALGLSRLVVIDDGSGPDFAPIFTALPPGVRVLRHAVNLGKGAALKTGLNYILVKYPDADGAVTADADGQHTPTDIARLAAALHPEYLVLGTRSFNGSTPWRSRAGNRLSAIALRALVGQRLHDTQTGLRAIPRLLIPYLLQLPANGYEFELDMLVAAKHRSIEVHEVPIETIYRDGNRTSHFNPLWDSMRVYFVFLRFAAASLLTALIDNSVFLAVHHGTSNILISQLIGRASAVLVNYGAARRAVFQSRERNRETLPKFLTLVAANAVVSYGMIMFLHLGLGWRVMPAKLSVEALLFLANFAIQRDFVFTRKAEPAKARAKAVSR
jgi:putative flippase GtrA